MTATRAAIAAFRSAFSDPERALAPEFVDRRAYFNLLWAYYKSSAFEDTSAWATYRETFGLYRKTRSIYNPTKRLVNFYVAQVYPGVLSTDARRLPDGVPLAIPLSDDTGEDLKAAVAQFWQWSNWQSGNKLWVRYGAATGSAMVELVDDLPRGKVWAQVRWPGLVKSIILDGSGNVKAFTLEYETADADGKSFTYRKEVDVETFKYFRDDSPFTPEGKTAAVEENPYGFVPAVWVKHTDEGHDFGSPAVSGALGKIDELNGLVSQTHDAISVLHRSPGIIATSGGKGAITSGNRTADDEYASVSGDDAGATQRRPILKAPPDTKWIPMAPNLNPAEVEARINHLYGEIERDFPELKFWEQARGMSQLTGVAVDKLSGDVKGRLGEAQSNYDQQSVKLFQMAAAVAGFRLREGREGWRERTAQRAKFGEFDLESYERGELDMEIMPRPLVPPTQAETIDLSGKRLDNAKKAQEVGYNADKVLEVSGVSDEEERTEMLRQKARVDVTLETEQ